MSTIADPATLRAIEAELRQRDQVERWRQIEALKRWVYQLWSQA